MLRYLYAIFMSYITANLYRKIIQKMHIKAASCLLFAHSSRALSASYRSLPLSLFLLALYLSPSLPLSLSLFATAAAATICSIKIGAVLLHSCVRLNAHNCVRARLSVSVCVCVCVCACLETAATACETPPRDPWG